MQNQLSTEILLNDFPRKVGDNNNITLFLYLDAMFDVSRNTRHSGQKTARCNQHMFSPIQMSIMNKHVYYITHLYESSLQRKHFPFANLKIVNTKS